jgi:hypothetical protein
MGKKYEREDVFGNKYWEDEEGHREYEREGVFGDKYREDDEGHREYEREDIFGNKYREDEGGNRTYEREDIFGNKYEETEDKGGGGSEGGGGGCFLTTACVKHAGLADDCRELQVLRALRDGYVAKLPDGPALISQYYEMAPRILRRISACNRKGNILEGILGQIRAAVQCAEDGRPGEALAIYKALFQQLILRFPV